MNSKYKNAFKSEVLTLAIDRELANAKKAVYKANNRINEGYVVEDYSSLYFAYLDLLNTPWGECASLLNVSKKRKASKVRSKVSELVLSNKAVFVTLTFKDSVLAKTSPETRRRYVARFLKANCSEYVANLDFGGKKGREHYHALIPANVDLKSWRDAYGSIDVERVKSNASDLGAVSLYMAKLTNHALKLGEKAPRLIYSRNK